MEQLHWLQEVIKGRKKNFIGRERKEKRGRRERVDAFLRRNEEVERTKKRMKGIERERGKKRLSEQIPLNSREKNRL